MHLQHLGSKCCLHKQTFPKEGLPDCGSCPVAEAYHSLDEENIYPFQLFQKYLTSAIINPFPMSTEPILLLDMAVVRFVLEAEGIDRREWPDYVDRFQAMHRASESVRPRK